MNHNFQRVRTAHDSRNQMEVLLAFSHRTSQRKCHATSQSKIDFALWKMHELLVFGISLIGRRKYAIHFRNTHGKMCGTIGRNIQF